jgi:hypothetical protein
VREVVYPNDAVGADIAVTRTGSVGEAKSADELPAALRERDPDYIGRSLRLTWPLIAAWFRPDIRGLDRIPATVYEKITGLMQQTLDELDAQRRWPLIG